MLDSLHRSSHHAPRPAESDGRPGLAPNRANIVCVLLLPLLSIAWGNAVAADPTTAPLIQKADLVYQGAFRVPDGGTDYTTFNYGGTALTYRAGTNSLFLTGHDWYQRTAEISIPAPVNSSNLGSLNRAVFLQAMTDATEGTLGRINPGSTIANKIGGALVYNGKLVLTGYAFYDADGTQAASHWTRPINLATTGQLVGPYSVGSDVHYTGGYMTLIPTEWQALLGGPALTGQCCISIISVQSAGPSVTVFDPAVAGQTGTTLLVYPLSNPLQSVSTQNDMFNLTTHVTGVVFPSGTRSVLFFGRHGTGPYCYGTGGASGGQCYDPADADKAPHAYPYVYQVWAYDANDLLAVKNRTKLAYSPQPYAVWTFSLPNEDGKRLLGGAGYDPANNLIYLSALGSDGSGPLIHVFKVQGASGSPQLVPPANLRVR